MRILVTGGAGFAGRHLLRLLTASGEDEVVVGTQAGAPADAGSDPGVAGVRWAPLDVTARGSVEALLEEHRPERVYHLAGQASVAASFADPAATWEVNALGTVRLLGAMARQGLHASRVLVVSSAEVYGAVPAEAQPIPEEAPLLPITPYGASKAAAEMAARQAAATGLDVVVARSFNHTGPGQDARFALPGMARQLARIRMGSGEPVLRVGNLEPRRDFLDVRDVVRAYRFLMERGEAGGVYNVCSGAARPLGDLVRELVDLSGTGARIEVDPARFRPADIPVLVGDGGRLRALGWRPELELRRTMRDLLQAAGEG